VAVYVDPSGDARIVSRDGGFEPVEEPEER
jgi:hypothetical protein